MTLLEAVTALKQRRCYSAAITRYSAHLKACKELEVDPDPFGHYAEEILGASDEIRASMLAIEGLEPYEPLMSYPAYVMPITSEMFTGTPPGSNKPRGPRKPKQKAK